MSRYLVMAAASLAVLGCADRTHEPTGPISVPVFTHGAAASENANGGNFGTPLSGAEEVPARETLARGNSIFQLSGDGQTMSYKLIVANIENAHMAHIHIAPQGANGPVAVWLYPSTSPGPLPPNTGRKDGVIADGSFTAANFVGPLAGQPMSALVAHMKADNAYVNVHTTDGSATLGPGNFPGGEVRGQIEHRGH